MSDKATERVKALTKKKGNLNCFDCGTLATGSPQAVLSPYGVFVCVTCGGLHRELQHRTKGVSMSTFKDEEADFMETHGNKRMKSTYYAYFDASKHAPLDKMAGDANKLRPFLKMVYEEKLFHIDNPSNSGKNRVIYPEAGEATQQKSSLSSSSSSFNFPSTSSAIDDPFGFAPSPAPSSQSQSSSTFSSAPATGTTGRLSAAPPTASTSRVVRGSRATSNASGGATSLDNFDSYYNVGSGAAVVSSTKTLSTTSSTSNDPFSFGATSTTPPGQQSSAAAIAAAKPKQQTVSDILGGLGDLYAAAPLSQKQSPQFQQQQQQNVSQTQNSPFDFGGQQQQQQPQQQQWGVQSTSTFPQAQAQSSWGMQPQQVISPQPQNFFNSQNAYGSTQHQQQQQANVGAFQQGSFATQTQKPSTQPQQNLDPFSSFGDMSSTINQVVPIETFTTRDFGHQASQTLQQSVTSHASHDPFGGFGGQATMSTVSNAPSLSRPSTTVQASNDPFGNSFGSSSQFGSTSSTTTTTAASFGGGHFSTSTSNVQMNAPNPFSSPPPQPKPSGPVNPFDLF
jgi:hypothetical protein